MKLFRDVPSTYLFVVLASVAAADRSAAWAAPEGAALGTDTHFLQGSEVCEDAQINSVHPDTNSGSSSKFSVFRSNAPIHSLIRFDLSGLPKDTAAKDVALMMYMVGESYAGMNNPMMLEAYAVATDWREDEVTWRNRTRDQEWQTAGGRYDHQNVLAASDIPALFGKGWIALKSPSLTRMVNLWITGQKPNHGLLLQPKGEPGGPSSKRFVSSEDRDAEYRAYRPKLIISTDQPVNPADHGFLSDAELVRRSLRERLNRITSSVRHFGPESKDRVKSLSAEIEALTTADDAPAKRLEGKLDALLIDLMREVWPGKEVVIWPISPWPQVLPDQVPQPGPTAIATRMLRNEYQELSLAVTNVTDREQTLDVHLAGGAGFPAEKLTLRASYWVEGRGKSSVRGEGLPIMVDDALPRLDEDKRLKLEAGQTRRLWLTVNSHDVSDGDYQFTLKIGPTTEGPASEIPIRLRVLPAALRRDKELSVHTYAYLNRPSTREHKAFTVNDLKAHCQNTYVLNLTTDPKADIVEPADYSEFREHIRLMRDAKMIIHFWHEAKAPRFLANLPWLSDPWKNALRSWLPNYVKVLREEGFDYDRFMLYPFDETYDNPVHGGRPEYQALEEIAQEIHKIDPRIKVFCNPAAFGPDDRQAFMKLADDIAIWSLHFLIFKPGDNPAWPKKFSEADKQEALRGFFAEERKSGKPVWAFQIKGRHNTAEDVNLHYRRWAWQIWHAGLTGMGLWSYNDIRGESGWTDRDGVDSSVIYELRDAPEDIPRQPFEPFMPSRRWQAWRAGVQDYFLLQQVRQSRPDLYPELRKLAEEILDDSANHATYEKAREALIDYLVSSTKLK